MQHGDLTVWILTLGALGDLPVQQVQQVLRSQKPALTRPVVFSRRSEHFSVRSNILPQALPLPGNIRQGGF
jgi:hypothetical protein